MKSLWFIAFVVLIVIATIIAFLFSTPLQIEYHKYALERLHEEIYAEPTVNSGGLLGYGDGDQFERQDEYCKRLAALGFFFHKRYEMEHLPDTGEVHGAFWRLVQNEFPDRRYLALTYPDNVLEVWDLAEYQPDWDAFVGKHNVPDFVDRFMTPTEDGEQKNAPELPAGPNLKSTSRAATR